MHIRIGKRTILAKTCVICGVLKMANQFGRVRKVYLDSYCRACHNAHGRPVIRNHQKNALKGAVRHRQPWSDEEVLRLCEMVSEGRTGPEMALALNRSVYAVYCMKNRVLKES